MIKHTEKQGTPEWLALRTGAFCASESPMMMGVSSYGTRSQLLDLKKSGNKQPISDFQQSLFDRGHAAEEKTRAILEVSTGQYFSPITASVQIDGMLLLASLDGITDDGKTIFECKLWNEKLVNSVSNGIVPESHKWQLVHQLIVAQAEKVIFVVSDGTEENMVQCDFYLNDDDKTALIDGWKQFDIDLQNHVITPIINLPAITLDISEVALNLHTPEKLVDKIRIQAANVGVFDISNEKGRIACNKHYNQIKKCINPAIAESKALASSAKKVIADDLNFRKIFESGVREIAEMHRLPLTEYEQVQKDIADKKARDERIEAERIENERLFALLWDEAHFLNDKFDFDKEKAEAAKAKQAEQDEKDRVAREAELVEQGRLAAEQANKDALAKAEREKLEAEQREKQAVENARIAKENAELLEKQRLIDAENARIAALEKAERERLQAVEDERKRVEAEALKQRAIDDARNADKEHRGNIMRDVKERLMLECSLDEATAKVIVHAVLAGKLGALKIEF